MKKTGLALLLAICMLGAAAAETISFSGTVEASETAQVYGTAGLTVETVPVRVGQAVTADTVIATLKTTKVYAPEDGTVIFCGERPGYGTVVEIKHENGFVSRLSSCANVAVELEQHVKRGAVIGYMPAIEGRGAPILHYELLIDGIPYNPLYYLS